MQWPLQDLEVCLITIDGDHPVFLSSLPCSATSLISANATLWSLLIPSDAAQLVILRDRPGHYFLSVLRVAPEVLDRIVFKHLSKDKKHRLLQQLQQSKATGSKALSPDELYRRVWEAAQRAKNFLTSFAGSKLNRKGKGDTAAGRPGNLQGGPACFNNLDEN